MRHTLSEYMRLGYYRPLYAPAQTRATPRGCFAVATKPIPGRRTHLIADSLATWRKGQFRALAITTRCGRHLASVSIHLDLPDEHELCDYCVLAGSYVYRCYMGDALLYIGSTKNIASRFTTHSGGRQSSAWWPLVTRVEYVEYPDIAAALEAESLAIVAEDPVFNTEHTPRDTRRARNRVVVQERIA